MAEFGFVASLMYCIRAYAKGWGDNKITSVYN
jgi:hypothetical protein